MDIKESTAQCPGCGEQLVKLGTGWACYKCGVYHVPKKTDKEILIDRRVIKY